MGKVAANVTTGTVLTNNATVASSTQDPVSANNAAAPVNTTVTNNAALALTKTAPATACAGDNLTYNISVTNSGISSALNVAVNDIIPSNTSFFSVAGTNAFANACSFNPGTGTLTCNAAELHRAPASSRSWSSPRPTRHRAR